MRRLIRRSFDCEFRCPQRANSKDEIQACSPHSYKRILALIELSYATFAGRDNHALPEVQSRSGPHKGESIATN